MIGVLTTTILLLLFSNKTTAQIVAKSPGRLAAGAEFSSTGLGAEVGIRIEHNFFLRGGISTMSMNYPFTFDVSISDLIKTKLDYAINENSKIKSDLEAKGLPTNAGDLSATVDATAALNFFNGKLLLDYYPWEKSAFHITLGTYVGNDKLLKINGKMPQAVGVFDVQKANAVDLSNDVFIDGKDYQILVKDLPNIEGTVTVDAVKPYFGLGLGRAVPEKTVGFNFDIGALYQGKPSLSSDNSNVQKLLKNKLDGMIKMLHNTSFYPVISLKMKVKLF
jgi:hypothetical protein